MDDFDVESLLERVRKVLRKEFSSKELLMQNARHGMIGGWIISKSFDGLSGMERQRKVWRLFEKYLVERDRLRIVGFHTFTLYEKRMAFDNYYDDFEMPARRKPSPRKKTSTVRRARDGARKK